MPKTTLRKKWTAGEAEELYARWQTETLDDIALDYGVTRQRIFQVLTRFGFENPRKGQPPRVRTCAMCAERYPAGEYAQHVAAKGHLWSERRHMPATWCMYDEYIAMAYQRGDRLMDISLACGQMTFMGIYRALRRRGIEPDRGGGTYVRDERYKANVKKNRHLRKLGLPVTTTQNWRAEPVVQPYRGLRPNRGKKHGTSTDQERPSHPSGEG